MDFYTWNKKDEVKPKISSYFLVEEFECRCFHCDEQKISVELVNRLTKLRETLGDPIQITSGFRCAVHQRELAVKGYETAKGVSQHELGLAADVNTQQLYKLWIEALRVFQSLGYSHRFIHVDMRDDKQRHWYYKN